MLPADSSVATYGDQAPDRLDDAERPRPGEKPVDARQGAAESERRDEPRPTGLQPVHEHHERKCDHSVGRQQAHNGDSRDPNRPRRTDSGWRRAAGTARAGLQGVTWRTMSPPVRSGGSARFGTTYSCSNGPNRARAASQSASLSQSQTVNSSSSLARAKYTPRKPGLSRAIGGMSWSMRCIRPCRSSSPIGRKRKRPTLTNIDTSLAGPAATKRTTLEHCARGVRTTGSSERGTERSDGDGVDVHAA